MGCVTSGHLAGSRTNLHFTSINSRLFFSFECEMEVGLMTVEDTGQTALKTEAFCLSGVPIFLICKLEKIPSVGSRFSL